MECEEREMNNPKDRQIIGMLNCDSNEKPNVFINRNSAIQYMLKALILPAANSGFFTGYMSSFENNTIIEDDDRLEDDDRIDNFINLVKDKLFIFSCHSYYRNYEPEFPKMSNVNLMPMPDLFTPDTYFYSVPVFAAANDQMTNEWEEEHKWNLYREYNNIEEFTRFIIDKKSVGRIYGYSAYEFCPSFIVWRDEDGTLSAIGNIINNYYTVHGGLHIFNEENLYKTDICDYMKYIIYSVNINPTLMFIPSSLYKEIEQKILKKTSTKFQFLENDHLDSEELIEIDTSYRNDELIISLMDYYSQKENLFYSLKDFVNVHTAIKCSNLTILSGLSGTGKSQLINIYAKALGINHDDDNRLLFVPVRPSWNDDSDLLGYMDMAHMVYRPSGTGFVDLLVNAQKEENKNKLFIVCFDEMNLARVEHYFSQFLSILERPLNQRELRLYDKRYTNKLYNSNEYPDKIWIGDNIRFIGTVNIDETTYHFSDKVLDRANVIQLDVLDYSRQWTKKPYAALESIASWSKNEYNSLICENMDSDIQKIRGLLWDIHQLIKNVNSKYGIGPRIVKSIESYICNLPETVIDGFDSKTALDYQIVQRILTKVRGPENQLGEILRPGSEENFEKIFNKYKDLSGFERCRKEIIQKQKELETYGYCI